MANGDDILARLRDAGVADDLLREVEGGFMRDARFTQGMQELAQMRERLAYELGQKSGQPVKKTSALEQFFSSLPDTEEARGVKELFTGALNAFREDARMEQQEQLKPLLSYVGKSARSEALDRRLQTELRPTFGPEIETYWPKLREQMLAALDRDEVVDPIGFAHRALGEKAQELMLAARAEQQQQQAAQTGEGFATIARKAPSMGGAPSGARVAEGGGTGAPEKRVSLAPTMAVLNEELQAIAAQVASGNGRSR